MIVPAVRRLPRGGRAVALALVVTAAATAACSSGGGASPADAARPRRLAPAPTTAAPPATTTVPPTTVPPTSTTTPPFVGTVDPVTAADLGATYHDGCPVGPDQLRLLHLGYWGFDGRAHVGTMVVAAAVTEQVVRAFSMLYAERFPIRSMVPESSFGGSDPASMDADNTSGFNCRYAVAPGPPQWSEHAYGKAIDVDPVENPYLEDGQTMPAAGSAYLDRADVRPGMAVAGGPLVAAFAAVGWQWGGAWSGSPDYQHFSTSGT